VAIYQDVAAPANGFSDGEIAALGQTFDAVLYDVATRAFGIESDIDANRVVMVLLTPVVNQLTSTNACASGFITGFFYAIDLDPAFTAGPRANAGEVFYSRVPEPEGSPTCIEKDRLTRMIPACSSTSSST
jgi:hypothetical protein